MLGSVLLGLPPPSAMSPPGTRDISFLSLAREGAETPRMRQSCNRASSGPVAVEACLVVDRPFCELGPAITAANFFAPYARARAAPNSRRSTTGNCDGHTSERFIRKRPEWIIIGASGLRRAGTAVSKTNPDHCSKPALSVASSPPRGQLLAWPRKPTGEAAGKKDLAPACIRQLS